MRRQVLSALERSSMALATQIRCMSSASASTSAAFTAPSLPSGIALSRAFSHQSNRLRSALQPTHRAAVSSWQSGAGRETAAGAQLQQQRSMFIQTSTTPNPASLMFLPGEKVMQSGSAHFDSPREGMASPLAKRLFAIEGVTGVFYGSDFVTVTKAEDQVWSMLKPEIFAAIMEHFTSGDPLFTDPASAHSDTAIKEDDSEVVAMIKELLETRIRPAVMEDGGDIVFQGFDEETGQVVLKMQGACSGCPSSSLTLKSGIENMLMHYIPEVKEVVEAPADEAELAGLEEFNKLENKLEQHLSA